MQRTAPSRMRIGMLSTYPPTQCGLATFSAALTRALTALGHRVDVFRVEENEPSDSLLPDVRSLGMGASVRGFLVHGSSASIRRTSRALSDCDAVIVQHEYGIFGGPDGDEVLDVLRDVDAPLIVVLHTVPQQASGHQTDILIELCELADSVVVMSESARERLMGTYYPIQESKVSTIPHGATLAAHVRNPSLTPPLATSQLLTWGLIGPGKGIEHVIDALGLLYELGLPVRYTIAGTTHPKVLAREGHRYQESLDARARINGVRHLVAFDQAYRGVQDLTEYLTGFGTVVLPYDTHEQVTSGVLVDSLAAGRAVISTEFPHAIELLSSGAGILVPHRDPRSMAVAIRTVTSEPERLQAMQAEARAIAPSLSWESVALSYVDVAHAIATQRSRA